MRSNGSDFMKEYLEELFNEAIDSGRDMVINNVITHKHNLPSQTRTYLEKNIEKHIKIKDFVIYQKYQVNY